MAEDVSRASRRCLSDEVLRAVLDTQAGAAGNACAQYDSASFTLAAATTLDFITRDCCSCDNFGGIALNIQSAAAAAPEQGTVALMLAGLIAVSGVARSKRQRRG